jgi:hypothetical protein
MAMKGRELLPPLATIESGLFSSVGESRVPAAGSLPVAGVTQASAPGSPPFAAGQIRRIAAHLDDQGRALRTLARPVAMLLDQPAGACGLWSGWLVATEVDYATAWDLLLESEGDRFVAPFPAMVQVWNPLQCRLAGDAELLATLPAQRLEAVRAVAALFPCLAEAPQPGGVAERILAGHRVLTGSPLGGGDDERRAYQSLYLQLAWEFSAGGATANVAASRSLSPPRGRGWLLLAAAIVALQAAIIAHLMSGASDANRSPAVVALSFSWRPEVQQRDVDLALQQANPDQITLHREQGAIRYQIRLGRARGEEVKAILAPLVVDLRENGDAGRR